MYIPLAPLVAAAKAVGFSDQLEIPSVLFLALLTNVFRGKIVVIPGSGYTGDGAQPLDVQKIPVLPDGLLNDPILGVGRDSHEPSPPSDAIFFRKAIS